MNDKSTHILLLFDPSIIVLRHCLIYLVVVLRGHFLQNSCMLFLGIRVLTPMYNVYNTSEARVYSAILTLSGVNTSDFFELINAMQKAINNTTIVNGINAI